MKLKFRNMMKEIMIAMIVAAGLLWAADLPGELGLDVAQTRENLLQSVISGSVPFYEAKTAMLAATPEVRATLTRGVLEWAKGYSESPEFAAAYTTMRNESMPIAPGPYGSVEDEIAQERAKTEQQIEEMKKMAAELPADQRPALEEAIQSMIASTEHMYSDPEMYKLQVQMVEMKRVQEKEQYDAAMEKWKESYPEDPRLLITRRLQEFLTVSADVDFNAQLVEEDRKMKFADPQYEEKPAEWKLCYRAGKETVEAARAFATSWLATLPQN